MSSQVRFIDLVRPITFLIPEISRPTKNIKQEEKFIWTAITLFIFLICSQIPLYGIYKSEGSDPLYWMRVILASNTWYIPNCNLRYDNASFSNC